MKFENQKYMQDKIIIGLTAIVLLCSILSVLFSLIFYTETHESCLERCEEKYQYNIDNSLLACEERCDERYKDEGR